MLASLTAGATILPAQAQETTAATSKTAVISSVAILQTAAQSVSVRVDGEGKLDARAARLQNPDRLVLDFSGARLGTQKTVVPDAAGPVRDVRLGQYRNDVVRVVIDLAGAARYSVSHDGRAVVVDFTEGGANTSSNASVPTAKKNHSDSARFALPGELTQPGVVLASYGGKSEAARPSASAGQAAQAAAQQANTAAGTLAGSTQVSPMAAPAGPRCGTSTMATARSSRNASAYTSRSQPVRPTMISTNPAAPTLTFTIWPMSRMRSQDVPASLIS
jgi:hypothetical protein